MAGHGKRAGARPKRALAPRAIALAGAGVAALALWAYLVWSAIHFGSQAREGQHGDWWWAGATTIGAIAALFACLLLMTRSLRSSTPPQDHSEPHHAKGGKRAAR